MKRGAIFYWTLGLVLAALIVAASFYLDAAVWNLVLRHQNRSWRNLMLAISRFGDWPEHFALGVVLAAVAWWRGSQKWTRIFLVMLLALSISGLAGRAIKISTGRARPSVKSEQMWTGPTWSSKYHSFPSGHVDASVGFFAALFLANRRVGLPCLIIPAVIGVARIYLGAHWLSDVVCAALLGIFCAVIVWQLFLRRLLITGR